MCITASGWNSISDTTQTLLYYLGKALYNVFLHPLSKFPGPPLRVCSPVLNCWDTLKGQKDWSVLALHEKYGDVVRTGPANLSFRTAQAWKDIYGTRAGRGQMPKDPAFYLNKAIPSKVDLINANDTDHTRHRRLISHAFSDKALLEQEPLMNKYFEKLITRLGDQIDGPAKGKVDMKDWLNFTTFDLGLPSPFSGLDAVLIYNRSLAISLLESPLVRSRRVQTISLFAILRII